VRFSYYDNLSSEQRRIYDASDRIRALRLFQPARFAGSVDAVADAFQVPRVVLRVLLTRPSNAESELHGLYTHEPGGRPTIEVWMRTARHGRVVAFRTYLRTVLHEVCHHLDFTKLGLEWSFHTRGFFQRESSLVNQLAPQKPKSARASSRTRRNPSPGRRAVKPGITAEKAELVTEALNFLGEAATPEGLATLRRLNTDPELTTGLRDAIQICLDVFGRATAESIDLTETTNLLEELLDAPTLLEFQDPIGLAQRLRLVLDSLGFELPEPEP